METKEKRELTPEERRARKEARRKRQEELKRKKQKRAMLIGGIAAAVVVVALVIVLLVSNNSGGAKPIAAKGSNFVIAIDPGHGGEDTGMINGEAVEKEITFDICSKLKIMLESQGYDVVMTREEDSRLSKEERAAAANASSADLVVSVHCGYSEDKTRSGAVSHYKADSKESALLAENIQTAMIKENGAEDGSFKVGNYTILNTAEMPAVLIEVGHLSNTQEYTALLDDSYQNDTAKGIAKGIILSLDRE